MQKYPSTVIYTAMVFQYREMVNNQAKSTIIAEVSDSYWISHTADHVPD